MVFSCSTGKQINDLTNNGNRAFNEKNYSLALSNFEQVIASSETKGKNADWNIYSVAGISAFELKQIGKAQVYLEKITFNENVDASSISTLAKVYHEIDNLSKEIRILELYFDKFDSGENYNQLQHRILIVYVEIENWEKALSFWNLLSDDKNNDVELLEAYLKINDALEDYELADKTADKILTISKNNITALDYFANKYYKRAENLYKKEMEAYEKHKTTKQYNILLKKLKVVSKDFKKSRDYYETLYKFVPRSDYAKYLGNIYARLNNKAKSEYYRKLAEK